MTIGELIQRYCDSHGITNQQFAELSHVSKAYVSMLVNGRNPKTNKPIIPSVKTYQQIADAMGITLNELLDQMEKDTPSTYHIIPAGSAKGMQATVEATYKGLADAIVEKLRQSDDLGIVADDELMQMREDMRRDPELREIYSLSRKTTKDKMKQIRDFVRFVTNGDDEDETDTP